MKRCVRGVCRLGHGALLGALAACGGQSNDGVGIGGETHFLVSCEQGCSPGLSCIEGVCTRRCEPGFSSCTELSSVAQCVSAPEDDGARAVFSGTCDAQCDRDADCAPLGRDFACRAGTCRAELGSGPLALSSALPTRSALVHAVPTDTCETGLRWVGGDRPSAEMHPGSDCMGCHQQTGARPLLFGGTVYPTWGGFVSENPAEPLEDSASA